MQDDKGQEKQGGLSWSAPAPAATPEPTQTTTVPVASGSSPVAKYAALLAAGIIVGALVVWGWSAWRGGEVQEEQATATSPAKTGTVSNTGSAASPAASPESSLLVESPQSAGLVVSITKAAVSRPTWVVVYESRGGVVGNALGASLFFPNMSGGTVVLLRATMAGQTYFVGEQTDDGDRIFELRGDEPVRGQDGGELRATFVAQ